MASRVTWYRGSWWVRTRWGGNKKRDRKIGPTREDKRTAEQIARKINAALVAGTFDPGGSQRHALPCDEAVRAWHATYSPTFKPSYEQSSRGLVENHLVPYFGRRDVRDLREEDLLAFARVKIEAGLAPNTVRNCLSTLRRVLNLLQRNGEVQRNVAARVGEIMRRVDRRYMKAAVSVDSWTPNEVARLLGIAEKHEPRIHPILATLFYTGMRVGEALGVQWQDVDFDRGRLHVRRAWVRAAWTTPKSGKGRHVLLAPDLASTLLDLLAERRRECIARGWTEVPDVIFCTSEGTPWDNANLRRSWERVRRRARAEGIRPFKLHAARHTWASLALEAGKSVRWVADQLGHSDPALTLRTYAHAIRESETDLGFLAFRGSERLYPAPTENARDEESANPLDSLAPPARLELATYGLGNRCSIP